MPANSSPPIVGFVAYSGSGKTTLLEKIIPLFRQQGLRVAIIKHAHHDFDIDHPGKDSYRLRHAGATQTIVASAQRWALIHENPSPDAEPNLNELIKQLDERQLDLILVEGFKHESIPRIEIHRPSLGKPLLCLQDPRIIALACDERPNDAPIIPQLDVNKPNEIVEFILGYFASHFYRKPS
ncbi:MAG: molybdopterin-guanine dinucleotide biosynthesis protein B [Gammaproteobacteria bacterium]|nr:molybdopterin-guanine dinucleotide biosynthesis protein B [Gammaproteobacteria bacterium]